MKKVLLFFILAFSINSIFAAPLVVRPKKKVYAADIMIPLGATGTKISLLDMSRISVKDAEILRGDKMNFTERLAFKVAQKKLTNFINNDGSINSNKLIKKIKKADAGGGFHAGGFFLGLLLGLIGVIIALLINDDKKKSRLKWALIGWGVWIAIVLIAFAV